MRGLGIALNVVRRYRNMVDDSIRGTELRLSLMIVLAN